MCQQPHFLKFEVLWSVYFNISSSYSCRLGTSNGSQTSIHTAGQIILRWRIVVMGICHNFKTDDCYTNINQWQLSTKCIYIFITRSIWLLKCQVWHADCKTSGWSMNSTCNYCDNTKFYNLSGHSSCSYMYEVCGALKQTSVKVMWHWYKRQRLTYR
jgi:hypothetical protein